MKNWVQKICDTYVFFLLFFASFFETLFLLFFASIICKFEKLCLPFFAFFTFLLHEFWGWKCTERHRRYKSNKIQKISFHFFIFDFFCMNFKIENVFSAFFCISALFCINFETERTFSAFFAFLLFFA